MENFEGRVGNRETDFDKAREVINNFPPRLKEVAKYTAKGMSEKKIAERMAISEHTVGSHRQRIFNLLGIDDALQLVVIWDKIFPAKEVAKPAKEVPPETEEAKEKVETPKFQTEGPFAFLSEREFQVTALFSSGLSKDQVAATMGLRPNTISSFLRLIYLKLSKHRLIEENNLGALTDAYNKYYEPDGRFKNP